MHLCHQLAYRSRVAHFLKNPCDFLAGPERASPEQGIAENFNLSKRWVYRSRVAHFLQIPHDFVAQKTSQKTAPKTISLQFSNKGHFQEGFPGRFSGLASFVFELLIKVFGEAFAEVSGTGKFSGPVSREVFGKIFQGQSG